MLQRGKKDRNIPHAVQRKKANWIGHILRKNGLLKRDIKGKIEERTEVTEEVEEDIGSYRVTFGQRVGTEN